MSENVGCECNKFSLQKMDIVDCFAELFSSCMHVLSPVIQQSCGFILIFFAVSQWSRFCIYLPFYRSFNILLWIDIVYREEERCYLSICTYIYILGSKWSHPPSLKTPKFHEVIVPTKNFGFYGNGFFCFVQLIMTGVAVLVVDRLGRRPLLLGGVSGMVSPYYVFLNVWLVEFLIPNYWDEGCNIRLVLKIMRSVYIVVFVSTYY